MDDFFKSIKGNLENREAPDFHSEPGPLWDIVSIVIYVEAR